MFGVANRGEVSKVVQVASSHESVAPIVAGPTEEEDTGMGVWWIDLRGMGDGGGWQAVGRERLSKSKQVVDRNELPMKIVEAMMVDGGRIGVSTRKRDRRK